MKSLPLLLGAGLASAWIGSATPLEWHFEYSGGVPNKLVWQTEVGLSYYLFSSENLRDWTYVPTFPKAGTGGSMEHPFTAGGRGFFRIIAAPPAPEGFVLIPAGSFLMGDQSNPSAGYSDEQPVHPVQVSAFYMAKHEVTKAMWDEVRTWGLSNGYTDLPTGEGKATNHPVHSISWYAIVKWCNARSQKEGLTPCYTVSDAVYKTGSNTPVCNWAANGHRLPTEAEWEKAARGGSVGLNFPWGNTITHSQANYYSSSSYSYDVSPTRGYHPTYYTGSAPYTSPVGSFAPNGYGLYDMAGNVWERCWDWYNPSYTAGSQTDPRGPASGSDRLVRGGGWNDVAPLCRTAVRSLLEPSLPHGYYGFRPARSSAP